jgi:uncharacterized protein YfaS (alpha-2-macroglobulin family)
MNRLRSRLLDSKTPERRTIWRLAATYWLAGQRDVAASLVRNVAADTEGEYRELGGTFGSTFRDKAMILETLGLMGDDRGVVRLITDLTGALASDDWLSTQEIAYALIALMPNAGAAASDAPPPVTWTLNRGTLGRATLNTPMHTVDLGALTGTSALVAVTNEGAIPIYVNLRLRGLPAEGSEQALSRGLALAVTWRTLDSDRRIVTPDSVPPGTDLEVAVTVTNTYPSPLEEIALVHLLGADWEVVNTGEGRAGAKYQDIRDDRVQSYFDLPVGGRTTVVYRVTKTYRGTFTVPAIHVYAMYDESIRAVLP